jgi:DNA-binding NtrC family response regulator
MFAKPVILVVSSSASERETLRGLLDTAQCQAQFVESAEDGLNHVESPVDLVISGIRLDRPQGRELLDRWKAQRPEVPFLVLDVLDQSSEQNFALRIRGMGAAGTIDMSDSSNEIAAQIGKWLRKGAAQADHSAPSNGRAASENGAPRVDMAAIRIPPGTTLEQLERAAVEQSLEQHHGNRTHAAKELGISVRTLQRKLKAWGEMRDGKGDGAVQKREPTMRSETQRSWNANPAAPRQAPSRPRMATVS